MILRRSSIGVAAQAGNAPFAAATAALSWASEARGHSARISSGAGLMTDIIRSPGTIFPSIRRLKLLIAVPPASIPRRDRYTRPYITGINRQTRRGGGLKSACGQVGRLLFPDGLEWLAK